MSDFVSRWFSAVFLKSLRVAFPQKRSVDVPHWFSDDVSHRLSDEFVQRLSESKPKTKAIQAGSLAFLIKYS
jgi:hypothetical protein